ncbi:MULTISPECIES: TetR/AcrR family transcriptional regulator [unclassified Rhizobium]|uniref:TetR/AcrR family transcriptional regulator n=1 Tax=unclassified Rhizobium TaxID=2613769 RepID=UPI001AD9F89D|nr:MULTISPECIES: TetR/AcrR family transcriptional regulator [unclassified Rhizobium]MBO9102380.1 TetR/AcrR family transcriptional regulator [Rhizobium sp. L58/93]MBO9136710.1 TetR/AcrR family transcriptional regulator [Rhizobium sp. B209b/85]MBO9172427.1 TetR/AcrR family transcriptional regulator [Rhizobium sp. L245/93]MBO9186525.1 TetR/AcrR family transcriptional regulator [Rhizobium sp. E27B/91]QXZ86087.1 TetR/AcrR family transcriptional regulator [Rhizobium sp. K1/93]
MKITVNNGNDAKTSQSSPRSRGRPAKGNEAALTAEIVAAAQVLFLDRGYEGTSTDDIAALAKCSKRTLYTRFATKADLFEAVIIDFTKQRRPPAELSRLGGKTLSEELHTVAEKLVDAFLDTQVLALYFLVHSEARKFPELMQIAEAAGRKYSRDRLSSLLYNGGVEDAVFLADQFYYLIQGPMIQDTLGGRAPNRDAAIARARKSVDFFLRGCGFA